MVAIAEQPAIRRGTGRLHRRQAPIRQAPGGSFRQTALPERRKSDRIRAKQESRSRSYDDFATSSWSFWQSIDRRVLKAGPLRLIRKYALASNTPMLAASATGGQAAIAGSFFDG